MEGFAWQMSLVVNVYMDWMPKMSENPYTVNYKSPPGAIVQGTSQIKVLDMFCKFFFCF
jgi:hypothetical protein